MKPTRHALQRWAERFPSQRMAEAFERARRPGKSARKKILRQLGDHARELARRRGRYFLVSRSGAVFICAPPEIVITVFPLTGDQDWKQNA